MTHPRHACKVVETTNYLIKESDNADRSGDRPMSTVEEYHRKFLVIVNMDSDHPELDLLSSKGHQAIRALIEEIHDQGYVLGQLHADGLFPEGREADVAAREERLGIEDLKARARYRLGRTDAPSPSVKQVVNDLAQELAGITNPGVVRRNCAFCKRERSRKDDNHAPECPYWTFFG